MSRSRTIFIAKCVAVLSVPVVLWAYASGPDPRKTGVPGESLCTEARCHTGTPNPAGGSVDITFPGPLTYTPGVKQRLTVKITDPAARFYGFQVTARLVSDLINGAGGTFTPVDGRTQVICGRLDARNNLINPPCPSDAAAQVQHIEHAAADRGNTFDFDWTPPSSDVGTVRIFVAGNGANGDGMADSRDHIYTKSYDLTPAGSGQTKAALRSDQPVLQAFLGGQRLSSGTWVEIYGANLSSGTREWATADFNGSQAPTSLDGVGVKINNKDAFVRYISPTQINVQVPDDGDAVGPVQVSVTNANGTSDPITVTKSKVSPALLTTPTFNVGGRQYVAALFPDFQTFVGRPNLIEGVPFRPAKPGDTIIIFAVGCGPTSPPTPAGQFFSDARPIASSAQVNFGQTTAQAQAFLAAGAVGLCQFNVTVPDVTGDTDGDVRIDATVDGQSTGQNLFTTVQR